jgi:hypothetical protein
MLAAAGGDYGVFGSAGAHADDLPPTPGGPDPARGPATFERIRQIHAGVLDVGYAQVGPAHGAAVLLLHGWPYDIHSYLEVATRLADRGCRVIVPHLRGHGSTRFLAASTPRSGQQAALGADLIA